MIAAIPIEPLRELLRRAVLTLGAIPDPDLRFRVGPKTAWPAYVRETRDAYGSAPARWRGFEPTAKDISRFLDVLEWMNWYRRQGARADETVRLFTSWALGAPMWMLQSRVTTNRRQPASPQTVYNRFTGMLTSIHVQFCPAASSMVVDSLGELDEKAPVSPYGPDADGSDLRHLPGTPTTWMEPDGKPLGFSHPLAAAARKADAESAKARRRANRRRQKPKRKKSR